MTKSKIDTLFLDIDGCIFKEIPTKEYFTAVLSGEKMPDILPNVQAFLSDWVHAGHKLILTTGRAENFRNITISQLNFYGISYDQLIMNAGTGTRIIVNNNSSKDNTARAVGISIPTNGDFTKTLGKEYNIAP